MMDLINWLVTTYRDGIEVDKATGDRIFLWSRAALLGAVLLTLVSCFSYFRGLFHRYIMMPMFSRMLRGPWADNPRFVGHAREMERVERLRALRLAAASSSHADHSSLDDDDECPQLVPVDPPHAAVVAKAVKVNCAGRHERRRANEGTRR